MTCRIEFDTCRIDQVRLLAALEAQAATQAREAAAEAEEAAKRAEEEAAFELEVTPQVRRPDRAFFQLSAPTAWIAPAQRGRGAAGAGSGGEGCVSEGGRRVALGGVPPQTLQLLQLLSCAYCLNRLFSRHP